jgi:DNA-binding SARP family transcriptional activator/Tfp pilus assembly protein PilF
MDGSTVLRVQVLGEVSAWRGGDPIALGPASRRAVLGLLALAGGQPLGRTELLAGVWNGRPPPPTAVNVLQTHVKHLRRLLEPERTGRHGAVVRRVGDGYALHIGGCTVDVLEFRGDVAEAARLRRDGRLPDAAVAFGRALARWQGPPLADVPMLSGHPKLVALAEERRAAVDQYADVLIAAGRAADAIALLEEEAVARPLDETVQVRLIRAYQGAGRRDQAFATFHAARRRLADDLGVDPGPQLVAVYADLLHDTKEPVRTADAEPAAAQLVADLPVFAGRTAELSLLDGLLDPARRPSAVILTGPAGIGKTSLAVHWAHRVAAHFPDGQLYVNLRGFDPAGVPVDPADALRRFLDAIAVPSGQTPTGLDALAALYRSRLAGRRILVLLDNAVDAAQVRPLLPGGRGCLAVVTSRNHLAGLVAAEGARTVALPPLATAEASDLLARRIGTDRAAAEPEAVAQIADRCAGLPLALAIVAARAAIGVGQPLRAYADELAGGRRLDALAVGDTRSDLREVFSWSTKALSRPAARLFRLLGLHPGPDFTAAAAASLAGWTPADARTALAELVSASLVTAPVPGRFALHDLVRAYAGELVQRQDSALRRRTATGRMLAHYLHTAYAADEQLHHARDRIVIGTPPADVTPEPVSDCASALAWFAAEHSVLLALVRSAADDGRDIETWQLAWTLWTYLDRRGHWQDLAASQLAAIEAAGRIGGAAVQADAYRLLARAYTRMQRLDTARTHLNRALDLYRDAGDRIGQANTHLNTALVWEREGDHRRALEQARTALGLFTADSDRARARNAVGWYHALLGDYGRAMAHCRAALYKMEGLGQAPIWDSLGYAHNKLGRHAEAIDCFRRSAELYRALGDRHTEVLVLIHLAETHQARGDARAARRVWQRSLAILGDLDPPVAQRIRTELRTTR